MVNLSLSIEYLDISIQSQLSLSYKIETEKWTSKQTEYICRVIKQSARGRWKEAGASFKKNKQGYTYKGVLYDCELWRQMCLRSSIQCREYIELIKHWIELVM